MYHGLVRNTWKDRIRFELLKRQAPISLSLFVGSTLAVGYLLHIATGVFLPIPFYVPKFATRMYLDPVKKSVVIKRYAEKLAVSFLLAYYSSAIIMNVRENWAAAEGLYTVYQEIVQAQEAQKNIADSLNNYDYDHVRFEVDEALRQSQEFRLRYESDLKDQNLLPVPNSIE
jgi:hypothetical protein